MAKKRVNINVFDIIYLPRLIQKFIRKHFFILKLELNKNVEIVIIILI